MAKRPLQKEVVTLGGDPSERKQLCRVGPPPWQERPLDDARRDIKGGDSRSPRSAGASGQSCGGIPRQQLGLSREGRR